MSKIIALQLFELCEGNYWRTKSIKTQSPDNTYIAIFSPRQTKELSFFKNNFKGWYYEAPPAQCALHAARKPGTGNILVVFEWDPEQLKEIQNSEETAEGIF